jgi:hypothetical protein
LSRVNLRKGAATLAIATFASPVLADAVLPIGGAFGNEAGCAFYATGNFGDDEMIVVTPYTLTSYATACYFESLVARRVDGRFEIAASCSAEGEDESFDGLVTVQRRPEGVFAAIANVGEWGPLFLCPGTEALFKPLGTPV